MKRAVFLDKDGTLIDDVPYNVDPRKIRLCAGAFEGLRELRRAGFRLFVVSNQSGVAHGYFEEEQLTVVEQHLREMLAGGGVELDGFYYCPHHPEGKIARSAVTCECRKPRPGLILRAAAEHQIQSAASWLVGDILNDIEAGRRAGCRTVFLLNGHETEWQMTPDRLPHHIASNLADAARWIVRQNLPQTPGYGPRTTDHRPRTMPR